MNIDLTAWIKSFQDHVIGPIAEGPLWVALFILSLAVGLVLKRLPERWVPNRSIPALVWLFGSVLYPIIMLRKMPKDGDITDWCFRNAAVGFAVSFFAWAVHRYFLKWAFTKLRAKLGIPNGNGDIDDDTNPRLAVADKNPIVVPAPVAPQFFQPGDAGKGE